MATRKDSESPEAWAKGIAKIVRGYVERHTAALEARIEALEAKLAQTPAEPTQGQQAGLFTDES